MYLQCTVYLCIHPAEYGMVVTCHSVTGREAISILYIHSIYILYTILYIHFVKLRQGSGKDWQGMAVKVKGLKD